MLKKNRNYDNDNDKLQYFTKTINFSKILKNVLPENTPCLELNIFYIVNPHKIIFFFIFLQGFILCIFQISDELRE